jgi:hypothetical protein
MKYLLTLLCGFLLGACVAGAGLYFNPFTQAQGSQPEAQDRIYSYGSPVTAALAFTHGNLSRLPTSPLGIPDLWEATINKGAATLLTLNSADGTAHAIASRISFPSEDTELLRRGVILTDHWLISVPGQGSLFITAESNWWPFLRDALIPVWYFDRPWPGPLNYAPTLGPRGDGNALVQGATGVFAGRTGAAAERYQIEAFDDRVGPGEVQAEIYWQLTGEPTTSE